jgi:hypothetical protein
MIIDKANLIGGGIAIVVMVVLVIIFAGTEYLSRKPLDQLPFRRMVPGNKMNVNEVYPGGHATPVT